MQVKGVNPHNFA